MYEKYGFIKVGALVPKIEIANVEANRKEIVKELQKAEEDKISILTTTELSLTGYSCQDLFRQEFLVQECVKQLKIMLEETKTWKIVYMIGMPIQIKNQLLNCAIVIQKGKILGIVPKTYLSSKDEFNEKRWFTSAKELQEDTISLFGNQIPIGTNLLFQEETHPEISFGVEISEDIEEIIPTSIEHIKKGANIIFNLAASPEMVGNKQMRRQLIKQYSAKTNCAYVYASAGMTESTSDLVFSGHSLIVENGEILTENQEFKVESRTIQIEIDVKKIRHTRMIQNNNGQDLKDKKYFTIKFKIENEIRKLERKIEANPFMPKEEKNYEQILEIQAAGLVKRILYTKSEKVVIGLSGGIDSTLAFLVILKAYQMLKLNFKNIVAISMPGFGTSKRTYENSQKLAKIYGVTFQEIDIQEMCNKQMKAINLATEDRSNTYENIQARQRTQILMNLANKENGLVIGTGDLSELALGWCTYNGDHMSMYAVNSSIPKTLVRQLIKWKASKETKEKQEILLSILGTPISPELLPTEKGKIKQKTEEILGDYQLHDFFLYHLVKEGEEPEKIEEMAKIAFEGKYSQKQIKDTLALFLTRFAKEQFKRNCMPDGPKVTSISLSPRGDWFMASDNQLDSWIK